MFNTLSWMVSENLDATTNSGKRPPTTAAMVHCRHRAKR